MKCLLRAKVYNSTEIYSKKHFDILFFFFWPGLFLNLSPCRDLYQTSCVLVPSFLGLYFTPLGCCFFGYK